MCQVDQNVRLGEAKAQLDQKISTLMVEIQEKSSQITELKNEQMSQEIKMKAVVEKMEYYKK